MYSKFNAAHRTRFFPNTENSVIEITYLTVLDTAKLKVINEIMKLHRNSVTLKYFEDFEGWINTTELGPI
jgi:hypothetical protein